MYPKTRKTAIVLNKQDKGAQKKYQLPSLDPGKKTDRFLSWMSTGDNCKHHFLFMHSKSLGWSRLWPRPCSLNRSKNWYTQSNILRSQRQKPRLELYIAKDLGLKTLNPSWGGITLAHLWLLPNGSEEPQSQQQLFRIQRSVSVLRLELILTRQMGNRVSKTEQQLVLESRKLQAKFIPERRNKIWKNDSYQPIVPSPLW